jgi:hypothetical protein
MMANIIETLEKEEIARLGKKSQNLLQVTLLLLV